jgi:hypothetical protein
VNVGKVWNASDKFILATNEAPRLQENLECTKVLRFDGVKVTDGSDITVKVKDCQSAPRLHVFATQFVPNDAFELGSSISKL